MQARLQQASLFGLIVAIVVVFLAGIGRAQSSNPFIGTWKMNVAKSTAKPGPLNKSGTVKIEAAGAGAKYTVDNVAGDGTVRHWEYTTTYDGKDSRVTGNSPYGDTAALTHVDATTVQTVNKNGGKVTATQTSVVSADGKTRTVTTKGTDAKGQPVDNVTFYDKQ